MTTKVLNTMTNAPTVKIDVFATPVGDVKTYGSRALWRGFITYFKGNGPCDG